MLSNKNTTWIDLTLPVYNGSPVFPGQPSPTFFSWTTLDLHLNATTAFLWLSIPVLILMFHLILLKMGCRSKKYRLIDFVEGA